MKTYLLSAILLFTCSLSAVCQDSLRLRKFTLVADITGRNGKEQNGYLQMINDSSVIISPVRVRFGATLPKEAARQQLPYYDIGSMTVHNRNRTKTGALVGAALGIAFGVATGLIMGDDPPETQLMKTSASTKAVMLAIPCGLIGFGVGAIIGTLTQKTFKIGGRRGDYEKMKKHVLTRAYYKPY